MTRSPNSLQYQIENKLIRIVGWSLALMAIAVLSFAVVSLYVYRVNKLDHAKELVQTKVSTEISGTIRDATALAGSSLLWTALTDSAGREAYLEPLLTKMNQSIIHKIELLDYRGRPVIDSRMLDLNTKQVKALIEHSVKTSQPQYGLDSSNPGHSTLLTTLIVNAPFADSPLGFLLVSFDLNKLVASIGLPEEISVHLSTQKGQVPLGHQAFWIQQAQGNFVIPTNNLTLGMNVIVEQSALYLMLAVV